MLRKNKQITSLEIAQELLQQYEQANILSTQNFYTSRLIESDKYSHYYENRGSKYPESLKTQRNKNGKSLIQGKTEEEIGLANNENVMLIKNKYGYVHLTLDSKEAIIYLPRRCCGQPVPSWLSFFDTVSPYNSQRQKRAEEIAKIVDQNKVASCELSTSRVFNQFSKTNYSKTHQVAMLYSKYYDHVIFLIGKKLENINFAKPATWPKDIAVLDAYANNCYPATEFIDQMKFLEKTNSITPYLGNISNYSCVPILDNYSGKYNQSEQVPNIRI